MILEMDLGNSRIKWRSLRASPDSEPGVARQGVVTTVDELLLALETQQAPELIRLASVRHDDSVRRIADWTACRWQIKPQLAIVSARISGVTNGYGEPARLGVDRWLAMLAGYHRTPSGCVVIDAGTAITVDAVDAAGQHLGGYILPGLQVALQSLENSTGIRLAEREFRLPPTLGRDTGQAVRNGVLAQVLALIAQLVRQVVGEEAPVSVLLSGGDAALLRSALPPLAVQHLEICPSLVLDGLALAETREFA